MSTGLTYVTLSDLFVSSVPELSSAVQVFSSYDEAYEYAEYLGKFNQYKETSFVIIWTSGPSQNGFWSGDPWIFTAQD